MPTCKLDADTIEFQVAGTVNLLSALPDLSSYITINGISADSSIVRRSSTDLFRIFTITSFGVVTLNNLTIQNGRPRGNNSKNPRANGGGILNLGNLTVVSNCKILDNTVYSAIAEGGGIYSLGVINIEKTIFSNNRAESSNPNCSTCAKGASIFNIRRMTIKESDISNSVGSAAIYTASSLTVTESKISSNQNGGIVNQADLTVKSSSIINNSAIGVTLLSGYGVIENSTISGNNSNGYVGGIAVVQSSAQITNTTITNNQGTSSGGFYIASCLAPCKITNNIIAGNKATGSSYDDISSNRRSYGGSYNLIGNSAGNGFTDGMDGNIVGTATAFIDPQLSPLGNYGGKTPTHKLLASSPAINAANQGNFPVTDQRGISRPVGSLADIGAVEFNLTPHRYLPNGGLNASYDQILKAFADSPNAAFSFAVSAGNLPPGLSLIRQSDATTVISGIPLQTGTYNFTITATNADNFTVSADYNLTIQNEVFFVAVSGRITSAQGRGISRAFVQVIDKNGNIINQTLTNPFGFYRFNNIQAQESYTFRVITKNRQFTTQNITINNETADLNFTAQPLPENFHK